MVLIMAWPIDVTDILLFVVMTAQVFICPFTKVEESFNLQAIHDVLYHRENITQYDHLEFPGVVPRSFVGPLTVSALIYPSSLFNEQFFTSEPVDKFNSQIKARLVLGILVLAALVTYKNMISLMYGSAAGKWLMLILASQFHFVFYMTRPLPNTFALILVLCAVKNWLDHCSEAFIWYSALSIIVFRAELSLLLGLLLLADLYSRRTNVTKLLLHAIPAAFLCLGLTILLDSYFWRRWLWPEGEVLWYNTVLNKSSNWGTQPYLWYLYSALPRAMLTSLAFVPLGLYYQKQTVGMFLASLLFVLLYSVLPHKELRFIIYVIPLWNTIAAVACARLWKSKTRSVWMFLLSLMAVGHLLVNAGATAMFTYTSYHNYPGGWALQRLHELVTPETDVNLHIDVLACQTGVSRFTQLHEHWSYNKTEDLDLEELQIFSHLVVPAPNASQYTATHTQLAMIPAYRGLDVTEIKQWPGQLLSQPQQTLQQLIACITSPHKLFSQFPLKVVLEPKLIVLKRK